MDGEGGDERNRIDEGKGWGFAGRRGLESRSGWRDSSEGGASRRDTRLEAEGLEGEWESGLEPLMATQEAGSTSCACQLDSILSAGRPQEGGRCHRETARARGGRDDQVGRQTATQSPRRDERDEPRGEVLIDGRSGRPSTSEAGIVDGAWLGRAVHRMDDTVFRRLSHRYE